MVSLLGVHCGCPEALHGSDTLPLPFLLPCFCSGLGTIATVNVPIGPTAAMTDSAFHLNDIDLVADHRARRYQKHETVDVVFAAVDGQLESLEGPNRYRKGDALITAETGERWVVSYDRFVPKYRPVASLIAGEPGAYENIPTSVLALRIDSRFTIARSAGGDVLHGEAGDWVLQYAPGDYGVVRQDRFARVYREILSDVTPEAAAAANASLKADR